MEKAAVNAIQCYDSNTAAEDVADTRVVRAPACARPCGAKTRAGTPCRTPAMPNGRCRMHGGTNPGAPKGNKNAWKHGLRSGEHRALRALLRDMRLDLGRVDA